MELSLSKISLKAWKRQIHAFSVLFFLLIIFICVLSSSFHYSCQVPSNFNAPISSQGGDYFENGDYIPSNELVTYLGPEENKNFTFPNQNELSIIQTEGLSLTYTFDLGVSLKRIQFETNVSDEISVDLELSLIDSDFLQYIQYSFDHEKGDFGLYYDTYLTLNAPIADGEEIILRFPIEDIFSSEHSLNNSLLYPVVSSDYGYFQPIQYTITDQFIELTLDHEITGSPDLKIGFVYESIISEPSDSTPKNFAVIILIVIGSVVVIVFILSSMTTEQFRSYFTRTAQPRTTFHRLNIDEIFENENRDKILDAILQEPGIHLSELMRITGLQSGQLGWHIEILANYGLIQIEKMGQYRVFYPAFTENPLQNIDLTIAKSRTTLDVLNTIKGNPGITGSEIGRHLNLKRNTVKYHIDKLTEKNFLVKIRDGNKIKLSLSIDSNDVF